MGIMTRGAHQFTQIIEPDTREGEIGHHSNGMLVALHRLLIVAAVTEIVAKVVQEKFRIVGSVWIMTSCAFPFIEGWMLGEAARVLPDLMVAGQAHLPLGQSEIIPLI